MSVIAVSPLLDSSLCILDLKSRSRDPALSEVVGRLGGAQRDPRVLRDALIRRERLASTAIGKGVALPNARSLAVVSARLVLARSKRGLAWDAGGESIHLLCAVISPADWSEEVHHEWLARAAGALRLQRQRQRLAEAADERALMALWREFVG